MRSGTNWFMDVVGQLPQTICFRDVFNPRGAFGINARRKLISNELADHLELSYFDESDPELTFFIRNDPDGFLSNAEEIAASEGMNWVGATIFPNHLAQRQLHDVFSNTNSHLIFLTRRHIDRAISLKKVKAVGQWKHIDTTNVPVTLDVKDIEKTVRDTEDWFISIANCLGKKLSSVCWLSFEDHIQKGVTATLEAISQNVEGFPWKSGDDVPTSHFERQDRSASPFEKIENGEALRSELERKGLLELAMGSPARLAKLHI